MISHYEQTRYGQALGVNPTVHTQLVRATFYGGQTGSEVLAKGKARRVGQQLRDRPLSIEHRRKLQQAQRERTFRLSADDVRHIRALDGTVPQREIGRQFGISQSQVSMIVRGITYRDVA